jgi:ribosome-associated protein
MKIKVPGVTAVKITGDFIRLDQFLKFTNLVSSGGEAKEVIQAGEVTVNAQACTMRGKKLRTGDLVRFAKQTYVVSRFTV